MKRVKDNLFHPLGRPAIAGLFLYLSGKFPWGKTGRPLPFAAGLVFPACERKNTGSRPAASLKKEGFATA